jgi:uncharacterized protein
MGRELLERFTARGHRNVQASHKTTLEFTKEDTVSLRGDCILGVSASLAPVEFGAETKNLLRSSRDFILSIRLADIVDEVHGRGHPDLSLDDEREMVFRKSTFLSSRTVLIACDKAATDLDARIKMVAKEEAQEFQVSLYVLD